MTLFRIGTAFLLSSLAVSCVVGGISTISEPHFENSASTASSDNGITYLEDLSISVRPENVDVGVLTGGILLPVIPLGGGNRVDTSAPFKIVIQFETEHSNYTFEPSDVLLELDGSQVQPINIFGPFDGGFPLTPLSSNTPGHAWGCRISRDTVGARKAPDQIAIIGKLCVVVEFPVNTVMPEQKFSVVISGLFTQRHVLAPIKVRFSEATRVGAEVLGGQ